MPEQGSGAPLDSRCDAVWPVTSYWPGQSPRHRHTHTCDRDPHIGGVHHCPKPGCNARWKDAP